MKEIIKWLDKNKKEKKRILKNRKIFTFNLRNFMKSDDYEKNRLFF